MLTCASATPELCWNAQTLCQPCDLDQTDNRLVITYFFKNVFIEQASLFVFMMNYIMSSAILKTLRKRCLCVDKTLLSENAT